LIQHHAETPQDEWETAEEDPNPIKEEGVDGFESSDENKKSLVADEDRDAFKEDDVGRADDLTCPIY
jgi:hypothetical protein